MPAVPTDKELYAKVKRAVYKRMPKHSAFRSGHLEKEYRKQFARKYAASKPKRRAYTYRGAKTRPLQRWFREKWTTQSGKRSYSSKSDIFRPTVRVSKKTPVLLKELSGARLRKARREKRRTGRVKRF